MIDCGLQSKLDNAGKQLESAIESSGKRRTLPVSVSTKCDRILKKWKYRSRQGPRNRFLPHGLCSKYENMVLKAQRGSPGFNLHSYEELMGRCSRIEAGTHEHWLDWDVEWLNPLRLSSKGWDFCGIRLEHLVCKCNSCKHTLCLDLNSGSSLNKGYWERYVISEHAQDCPWREKQFDLGNEYYLQPWNLIREIERIKESLVGRKVTTSTPTGKLETLFQCDSEHLQIFSQGYRYIHDDAIQCTGCFKRAFRNTVLQDGLNCHAGWCKYYEREKLSQMIESTIVKVPIGRDVTGRLKSLEKYFENI